MPAVVAAHHHDHGNFYYRGNLGVPWCARISVIMPATRDRVRYAGFIPSRRHARGTAQNNGSGVQLLPSFDLPVELGSFGGSAK
jgi:hypothetical protein